METPYYFYLSFYMAFALAYGSAKMALQLTGAGVELNVLVREEAAFLFKLNKKAPEPRKPQGQQDVRLGRPNGLQKNVSPFSASIP